MPEEEIAHRLAEIRDQLYDALGVKTTADRSLVEHKLEISQMSCLFHVGLSLADWGAPQVGLLAAWLRWLNALNLSRVRNPIVVLVGVVYPSGYFYRARSLSKLAVLRRDISLLANDPEFGATVHMLPELCGVRFSDVEQWIREYVEDVDHEVLRRLIRAHFSRMLGFGERTLSMYQAAQVVKAALNDPSVRMSAS